MSANSGGKKDAPDPFRSARCSYGLPPCEGEFGDVSCASPFGAWTEQLAAEGITGGCGGNNYCSFNNVTRGQMAAFLVNAFNLP